MNTALVLIATGDYIQYVAPLLASAKQFFVPHTPVLWSDGPVPEGVDLFHFYTTKHEGFPGATLHRYHRFLEADLSSFDQIFYCDVDMLFVAPVGQEIFSDGITATLHPGFVGTVGTPERRSESRAYIPHSAKNKYFCGGFQGGKASAFLEMAKTLKENIDIDASRGIVPVWHDESVYNRYLYDNPPAKVLTPEYCYPEMKPNSTNPAYYTDKWKEAGLGELKPKLLALEKGERKDAPIVCKPPAQWSGVAFVKKHKLWKRP
jgi:hypothetical protein